MRNSYGIVFYLNKEELKKSYPKPENYKQAYEDIRDILRLRGFHWLSNSFYYSLPTSFNMFQKLYRAIEDLKAIEWFQKSVESFNVFVMEDKSDLTDFFKGEDED
ncbi:virulence protein [[Mycoplasma] falconis]|uniref:Virulence protein n=1 Tax=[Mycoplasma] falconis TaxID=92403 RepID=A0A501XAU9_9BACT|nr:virulence protein [[Mycoplasma] falconis]TPE57715.1 virulence protein [[Mycoplasma] falconis]